MFQQVPSKMWLSRSSSLLIAITKPLQNIRYISNKSAFITKIHRSQYLRTYPTLVVEPDGSTYTIRHYEPRRIIKLPIDLSTLSEEEREMVLERRKPKKKVVIQEEIDDNFDSKKYLKYLKKNK